MTPIVSIVMSVYNDEQHLERSLDSLLEQSFENFELIVINDGSTDRSIEILEKYAKADSRVRLINQKNRGLTRALIQGCDEAVGEFIARQDADDWSAPDRLKIQFELIQSDPEIGFISCATQYMGPSNEPLEIVSRTTNSQLATDRLLHERQGPAAHGSVMFRKSVYQQVKGYRPEFYFAQDSDLWLRMGEVSRIAYSEKTLYFARREMQSISGAQRLVQHQFGELALAMRSARINKLSEKDLLEQAQKLTTEVISNRKSGSPLIQIKGESETAYLLGSQLAQLRDRRGMKYLWRVIKHHPFHWKAWVRLVQLLFWGKFIPPVDEKPSEYT